MNQHEAEHNENIWKYKLLCNKEFNDLGVEVMK